LIAKTYLKRGDVIVGVKERESLKDSDGKK
jgi:hypothetical protein